MPSHNSRFLRVRATGPGVDKHVASLTYCPNEPNHSMISPEVLGSFHFRTHLHFYAIIEVTRIYRDRLVELDVSTSSRMANQLTEAASFLEESAREWLQSLFEAGDMIEMTSKHYVFRESGKQVRIVKDVLNTEYMEDEDFYMTYDRFVVAALDETMRQKAVMDEIELLLGLSDEPELSEAED